MQAILDKYIHYFKKCGTNYDQMYQINLKGELEGKASHSDSTTGDTSFL